MEIIGIAGWSGSGKTTLIVKIIPLLTTAGLSVSTIKHAHHDFEIDKPGKDSYVHRRAGAREVMIGSAQHWALIHDLQGQAEPSLDDMIAKMTPVDVLLVEGFKWESHAKIEIHRAALGKPLLAPDDPTIIAIAADQPPPDCQVPVFDVDRAETVADFIIERLAARAA